MIKTQRLTPEIYYKESRDFQFFGRIYDIIFNYVKTNVDLMENFPINSHTDSKLIELLARTLGFNNKLNYRNDDLNAICNVFIRLMKEKGSEQSIHTLVKTLLNVEGIKKDYSIGFEEDNLVINLPDVITNPEIKLMEDVLDYILPIGICYNIRTTKVVDEDRQELLVSEFARATNLVDQNGKYTNIYTSRNNVDIMESTNDTDTTSSIGHEEDIVNPTVGDIRYTRVTKKVEGED